jgi:antitoxin component of MazEF toxin-antitoxin module
MNDTYKLRSVGGALMVTVPQKIARILRFNKGDDVKIGVVKIGQGGLMTVERTVKPTTKRKK